MGTGYVVECDSGQEDRPQGLEIQQIQPKHVSREPRMSYQQDPLNSEEASRDL